MNEFNVSKTRELDLCVSCEICLAVCPVDAISMEYSLGKFVPKIINDKCTKCKKCIDNCPGIDIIPLELSKETDFEEIIYGNYLECYTAFSKSEKIRKHSTSGGIITTLITELIENKEFQGAFVLEFDKFERKPVRLNETNDLKKIIKASKSKYLPASVFNVINKLKENDNSKLIIVGTPCQLFGIKKYIKSNKINDNNILLLGLFCSSTLNFNFLRFLQDTYTKHGETIEKYLYRTKEKYGWPGHSKIVLNSGRNIILDRTIRINLTKYFKLNRCLFCFDKANKSADIVFADCYIKNKEDVKGKSNILIRTAKGKQIFEKYAYLFHVEKEVVEEIWQSQNIQNEKQNLVFSKVLAKEKSLKRDIEEVYEVKNSDKKQLKKLQEYIEWGSNYRKKKN